MVNRSPTPAPAVVVGMAALWAATFAALVLLNDDLRAFWSVLLGMSLVGSALTLLSRPQQAAGRRPTNRPVRPATSGPVDARPTVPVAQASPAPAALPAQPSGADMADMAEVTSVRAGHRAHRALAGQPITTSALSLPKAGNTDAENEDAFAVSPDRGRVAVSDGASSAYRSGEWARTLCAGFVESGVAVDPEAIAEWLLSQAHTFQRARSGDAGWWDVEAAGRGAFATLVAVEFHAGVSAPAWRAVAVGDSVLIHLRPRGDGYVLVAGFPIESGEAFTSTPALVASTLTSRTALPTLRFAHGHAAPGDRWLALTDELARWALRAHESGMPIWPLLFSGSAPEVTEAVTAARQQGQLVNDDMTLIRIALA